MNLVKLTIDEGIELSFTLKMMKNQVKKSFKRNLDKVDFKQNFNFYKDLIKKIDIQLNTVYEKKIELELNDEQFNMLKEFLLKHISLLNEMQIELNEKQQKQNNDLKTTINPLKSILFNMTYQAI